MGKVLSKDFAQGAGDDAFTRALRASESNRNADRLIGTLYGEGHPSDQIIEVCLIPGADDIKKMMSQERPVTFLRLNRKASPQVEHVIGDVEWTTRLKYDAATH